MPGSVQHVLILWKQSARVAFFVDQDHVQQLFFVRHGETEWNAARRVQGQWNSDLNALGREQAAINGQFLASQKIEALFASPLDRTMQTAEIINQHLNLTVNQDDRLMEWDCGDWSGYLYDEVMEKWPLEWQAWQDDRFHYRGPNCENFPDMIVRSTPFLAEIVSRPERNIAIVSHGMIGKIMVAQLLKLSEQQTLGFHQGNDIVFRLSLQAEAVEVSHFISGDGPNPGLHA